jgi:tetratricopeptide (TPR) repeat protein
LLDELARAHLVVEHVPGRFRFHDLLRADARRRCAEHDPAAERRDALCRLVDHFVHSALIAARFVYPPGQLPDPGPVPAGVTPEYAADIDEARAWFAAERSVVPAVVGAATAAGLDAQVTLLGAGCASCLSQRGLYDDQYAIQSAAVAAAQRLGDREAEARARRTLGMTCSVRQDEAATVHFGRALALYAELGDEAGLGRTHLNLSWSAGNRDDQATAIAEARTALAHFERVEDPVGMAMGYNGMAWGHAVLGDHEAGQRWCDKALALLATVDAPHTLASTVDTAAYLRAARGEVAEAVELYREAVGHWRRSGDRLGEGFTWLDLGDLHERTGQAGSALAAWREALDILDEIGHPRVAAVRARLTSRRR